MRHLSLSAFLLFAACQPSTPPPTAPIPMPSGSFAAYLARASAGDTTLDFQALRLSYTTTPMYNPYGQRDRDRLDSVFTALDRDSFSIARVWADSLLADNPVHPEGQAAAGYIAEQLNDTAQADHHRWMAWGLVLSIQHSGAGTTESPFVVIAVYEEYALARFLELKRAGRQGLGECGGHACDNVAFTVPATGRDTTLFFDVSIPMAALEKAFSH